MDNFQYLLQVNLYLVLFFGFYFLVLRNETFFTINRTYLIGTALLSFIIPLAKSEWLRQIFAPEQVLFISGSPSVIFSSIKPGVETSSWIANNWLAVLYGTGVALSLMRLILQLTELRNTRRTEGAFSFFSFIKISENLPNKETILKHEQVHSQQLHSADILFFELIGIVNWFNPVVYLYKKAIKSIHEFIADEKASGGPIGKSDYALLLVSNTFGIQPAQLLNNFFSESLLKKRIFMLSRPRSRKTAILKYGFLMPLFAGMVILSAACNSKDDMDQVNTGRAESGKNPEKIEDFASVDVLPEFPGGAEKFYEYVGENFKYPEEAVRNGISGRVTCSFVVRTDGSLTDIKVLRDIGYGTGDEAVRLLKNSPKWHPGMQNNQPANVKYVIPIMLNLESINNLNKKSKQSYEFDSKK